MRPLIYVVILWVCAGLSVAKEKPEDLARPLLKLAADRALFLPDARAPFKVLVEFRVHGGGSPDFKGSYSWVVTPEGNSRKEVKMSGYEDVQVLKGTALWAKRNLDFMPLQVALAEYSMTNLRLLTSGLPIESYSKSSEHHTELQCVEVKQGRNPRSLCLDANGDLRRVKLKDLKLTYEYSEYKPFGSKFAPYRITAKQDGGMRLDAEVVSLAPATTADEGMIVPLPGVQKRDGCLNPSLPLVSKSVPPSYPREARERMQQGDVILYVRIASDGTLGQKSVVQTGGKALDDAVLAVAAQWKYEPARCQNILVDSEALIPVSFTLEIH